LLEKLDSALQQRLTLVCAPAGYGKTTLLSQWVERRKGPTGWVSLDRSDNDPAQFLRYFFAAIQRIDARAEAPAPKMLPAPGAFSGPSVWMPLVNQIATSEEQFIVILDDYQEVQERVVHEALDYFIERMPENMHLILATRADPPLSLPRLRARGHLSELRLSDLRFSAEETANFLNNIMNLGLAVRDIAALETRTEGWIASLQMAALSLQMHSPDFAARSEYIQAFTGSHRFILDYLVEEVLEHHPPELQDFLLKTSILDRMSGKLCDAIIIESERAQPPGKSPAAGIPAGSSQSVLEHLESANLFIVPLDDERRWYRYHRLFSDLLRKRLWQTFPELVPVLHSRASNWYEQQGFAGEAIQHALAAKSYERAAALIEANVETTLMRSEVKTLLNWMERLPEEYERKRSRLSFFHTLALLMGGQSLELIERRLQSIANIQGAAEGASATTGNMAALRAYLRLFQADYQLAARLSQQALENLPESDFFLRSISAWILSMTRLASGDLQDGKQALDKVIRTSQESGNPLIAVAALSHQARFQMRQGRLQLAHETLMQALQLATDPQGQRLPIASEALIGLGDLEREWNHLEKAEDYLTESIELARQWNELSSFDAYFPLMRLRLAQGDPQGAGEAIETAWQMAHRSDFSQIDDALADFQQAYYYIMRGDATEAKRWAENRRLAPSITSEQQFPVEERQDYIETHMRKYEQLVLARALMLLGQNNEALELLQALLELARQLARTDLAIEIHILRALAFQQAGEDDRAIEALAEALSLAEPGGYVRIFLDEGEPMTRLLRQAASQGLVPAYATRLLGESGRAVPSPAEAALAASPVQTLIEPLSERELEVLRLLATGLSNPEIASELYIAVSTIRTHCKSIYGKLGVHGRWEAAQRAQELGLI
jgi:LuxR family maltose regulon positive regulatory protein